MRLSWRFSLPMLSLFIAPGMFVAASSARAFAGPPPAGKVDYNFHIRPILSDRCFRCHGPDEKKRKADLRLDTPDGARAAGVIVPGKPDDSEVIQRITATGRTHMPPPKSGLTLSKEEIELIRRWIAEGAEYKAHWAYLPLPDAVAVPAVSDRNWPAGPLDCFILARLETEGLKPSPAASREDWIRRATFDLTGLPPAPADVDAFLADRSPRAFERVVDRLLASPRFGERMAQDWLDVARYADSFGYQADGDSHVWPWRDWVIAAFNRNQPFDEFLTWQIAGDLVPSAKREQKLATAFCRLNRMTNEGGSIPEEFRNEYVSDRVHTFSTALLGLTLECARCHDHKFDPFTMKDYYGLGAFFNSIDEWGTYDNSRFRPTPTLPLPTVEQERELAERARQVERLSARLDEVKQARETAFRAWLARAAVKPEIPDLVGHYPLDRMDGNRLENLADPKSPGSTSPANGLVPGKIGMALRFTGDDAANFPGVAGSLDRTHPFTISFWLQTPEVMKEAIVFHRQSGTDTGFHGTELSFDAGRLFFALIRFWPGNAVAIRTKDIVPANEWVHVTVSSDATGKAAGLRIYCNGKPAATEVIRDNLLKNTEAGGQGLTYFSGGSGPSFGERFRSTGLKGGMIDELKVFHRALIPVEVAHLCDGKALAEAIVRKDERALRPYYFGAVDPEVAKAGEDLRAARQRLFAAQSGVFEIMTMAELRESRPAYILTRGAYDAPKDKPVGRLTPAALPPFANGLPHNRLGLARWLTDPNHPLTARVAVNRVWQTFFGRGIVATTENFGAQGALPTHPELLDRLARDFVSPSPQPSPPRGEGEELAPSPPWGGEGRVRGGWDVKALCRRIVLSSTYRQRSAATPELRERDPDNVLLARGPSHRLSAEMLRDAALAAGGLLAERLGGPPVKPYLPAGLWRGQNAFLPDYVPDKGAGLYRRSMYTFWRRTSPPPNMLSFDAPSREVCVVRRQSTSTPLQPLVLLNDPQFVEAARALGERMLRHGGGTLEEKLTFAFRTAATRRPNARELLVLKQLFEGQRTAFRHDSASAEKYLRVGETAPAKDLDPADLAAAAVTASAILNIDAAVMTR